MAMATGYDYRKYQKVKAGERLKAWAFAGTSLSGQRSVIDPNPFAPPID